MQSSKIALLLLTTLIFSHTFGEEDETERKKGFGLVKKCIKTGMSPTGVEDLKTLENLRNAGICLRNCQKEEDCQAWRFSKSNKTCDLFSGFDSFEGNKMFLSGTKECLKKGKEQIKKCRKKGMSPTDVEELSSFENVKKGGRCSRKCNKTEDCKAWRFSKRNKTCELFLSFESFESNDMYISGSKEDCMKS